MPSRSRLRRAVLAAAIGVATLVTGVVPVAAAPGDLDPTFSDDGTLVVGRGRQPLVADAVDVLELPDGRLLVAGQVQGSGLTVTRLLADGRVDATFGVRGTATLTPGTQAFATSMALRADGSIVVVGALARVVTSRASGFVARFTVDGELDTSFGDAGLRVLDLGTSTLATDVVVGPAGSLFVGGAADSSAFVVRLSSTGEVVTSFGANGVSRVVTGIADAAGLGLRLARDGSGVVMSFIDPGLESTPVTRIVRLTATGAIDSSFGGPTGAVRDISIGAESPEAVVSSGGRVLVVVELSSGVTVVALDPSGADDASWGTAGRTTVDLPGDVSSVTTAIVDTAGRLVLSGTADTAGVRSWIGARLTAAGAPDATFGSGGVLNLPVTPTEAVPVTVSRAGSGYVLVGREDDVLVVRRLRASGALLDTFGSAGVLRFAPVASSAVQLADVSILPDGGSVALSTSLRGSTFEVNVWRFDASGRPVTSFGTQGVASWNAGTDRSRAHAIRRLDDGGFLVASTVDDSSNTRRVELMRLTANGRPDPTFGPRGRRLIAPSRLTNVSNVHLVIDDAGKYLVGVGRSASIDVARVRPSGGLDAGFGTNGVVSVSAGNGALAAMTELDGGQIVLVDTVGLRVIRRRANGSPDTSFGPDGVRALDVEEGRFMYAKAALSARGDIVLVGPSLATIDVARLTPRGSAVASFGTGGVLVQSYPPNRIRQPNAVVLRNDRSVVLVGLTGRPDGLFTSVRTFVMRLRSNGTLDSRFSGDGVAEYDLAPGTADLPSSISVRTDRMLVGATSFEVSPRMALARIRA